MAELALAILPLVISVVERYKDCLLPIRRYVRFSRDIDRFQRNFEIQRTIFQNQCRLLLEEAVHPDVAVGMLHDRSHMSWTDRGVDRRLSQQLGVSRGACTEIIRKAEEIVKQLEERSMTLATAMQETERSAQVGSGVWRSLFKEKLKYSFSKDRLVETLAELKELNESFIVLGSQTLKLSEQSTRENHSVAATRTQNPSPTSAIINSAAIADEASLEQTIQFLDPVTRTFTDSERISTNIQDVANVGPIRAFIIDLPPEMPSRQLVNKFELSSVSAFRPGSTNPNASASINVDSAEAIAQRLPSGSAKASKMFELPCRPKIESVPSDSSVGVNRNSNHNEITAAGVPSEQPVEPFELSDVPDANREHLDTWTEWATRMLFRLRSMGKGWDYISDYLDKTPTECQDFYTNNRILWSENPLVAYQADSDFVLYEAFHNCIQMHRLNDPRSVRHDLIMDAFLAYKALGGARPFSLHLLRYGFAHPDADDVEWLIQYHMDAIQTRMYVYSKDGIMDKLYIPPPPPPPLLTAGGESLTPSKLTLTDPKPEISILPILQDSLSTQPLHFKVAKTAEFFECSCGFKFHGCPKVAKSNFERHLSGFDNRRACTCPKSGTRTLRRDNLNVHIKICQAALPQSRSSGPATAVRAGAGKRGVEGSFTNDFSFSSRHRRQGTGLAD